MARFPPSTSFSAGLGDPGAPNGERVGSQPAFCYNSAGLPAELPAQPQPGCSGDVFQHGVEAESRASRYSVLQEVRRSGNEERECNGFICLSLLFLSYFFFSLLSQPLQVAFSLICPCGFHKLLQSSPVEEPSYLPRYVSWVREPSYQREQAADGTILCFFLLPVFSPLPLSPSFLIGTCCVAQSGLSSMPQSSCSNLPNAGFPAQLHTLLTLVKSLIKISPAYL